MSVFIGEPSYTKRSRHASPLQGTKNATSRPLARPARWNESSVAYEPTEPLAEAETSTETEMFAWMCAVIFAAA